MILRVKTGRLIVEAIINGERKAANFLPLVDKRVKAGSETICKSLQGNWCAEHLFLLKQSYTMYKFIQDQIALCDRRLNVFFKS